MKNYTQTEIRSFSLPRLKTLCDDIREEIFHAVSECGGHLASNLGAVELTVALFRAFDFPADKVVFDVGHQCYTYKLLTGRAPLFRTLRKEGGISGFPKREESPYDAYGTGHAGTAISAALGLAKARDLKGEAHDVIAVVGDGSFQNGLIYEALNSLKILNTKVLIILNDNGMSISPTAGGAHEILDELKQGALEDVALFEHFGLMYRGPVNGNDLEELLPALSEAKELLKEGSVLLHVVTKKGQGYAFSENAPVETHGVNPRPESKTEYSAALGEELMRLAEGDKRIAVVTAAMTDSLGLRDFFRKYPDRAFDVGICEEHATVLAAALAAGGMKPYYAVYSTFLERSIDEVIHDICGQKLPVTLCIDRAGITGPDGETHQGVFDLSLLSSIPNLTVAIPGNVGEFRTLLKLSKDFSAPLAIRYPRMGTEGGENPFKIGEFEVLHSTSSDIVLFAAGERCISLGRKLLKAAEKEGFSFTLVNARFLKPLDTALLGSRPEPYVITLEDNLLCGGLGDAVSRFYAGSGKTVLSFGYRDAFIPHGEYPSLSEKYGLSFEEILETLRELHARG